MSKHEGKVEEEAYEEIEKEAQKDAYCDYLVETAAFYHRCPSLWQLQRMEVVRCLKLCISYFTMFYEGA